MFVKTCVLHRGNIGAGIVKLFGLLGHVRGTRRYTRPEKRFSKTVCFCLLNESDKKSIKDMHGRHTFCQRNRFRTLFWRPLKVNACDNVKLPNAIARLLLILVHILVHFICSYHTSRAGHSKFGARLEALLRGSTQWRVQKFLRSGIKSS